MFRLLIQIQCDSCGELFHFARVSDYTSESLRFNTNVLSATLGKSLWMMVEENERSHHYCQSCYNEFSERDMDDTCAENGSLETDDIPF